MKKVFGYLFYIIGFFLVYRLTSYGLKAVIESIKFDDTATIIGMIIGFLILALPVFFMLKFANRWTNLKRKYFVGIIVLISVFSFISEEELLPFNYDNEFIIWTEKNLNWSNFREVKSKSDGFSASIYSEIYCPREITENNSGVYAYMSPSKSDRLNDSLISNQLLIHEQYHFNITEYYARLLRKEIVKIGEDKLTIVDIQSLYDKYELKRDSVHDLYDSISDHNVKYHEQRYWELKIDELLRETAYYEMPNLYHYNSFTKEDTNFFKQIRLSETNEVLTSHPLSKEEMKYGEAYEVTESWGNVTVKFYKNGKLTNGGDFETAITKIIKSWWNGNEIHYYNADETYNSDLKFCVLKSKTNKNDRKVVTYFNENQERVNNDHGVYETHWQSLSDNSTLGSYYNKKGEQIKNKKGIYHLKKVFDKYGRIIKRESFDLDKSPMNDNSNLSIYKYKFNQQHLVIGYKEYDKNGNFPIHSDEYNLQFKYDEYGYTKEMINFNEHNTQINNKEGVCIYNYCYDKYGNDTQTKRYNSNNIPTLGTDDYFTRVTKYDSIDRIVFNAKYYFEHTLKFDEDTWGATKVEYPNDSTELQYNINAYNKLFNDTNGSAIIKSFFDKKGQTIKSEFFDKFKNYAKPKNGVVKNLYKYDDNGNEIESISLDSLGNYKSFQEDVAIVRWNYDDNNNKIKTTYFKNDNELANAYKEATYNFYTYNEDNKLIQRRYFNINMEPIMFDDAFKTKFYMNSKGNDTLIEFYDINDKLIEGVSSIKYKYDKLDNVILESYFDNNNELINNSNGVRVICYKYNNKNSIVQEYYLDANNQITNNTSGYAYIERTLNENGEIITESFFDKYKKPASGKNGFHKVVFEYNEADSTIKESRYDIHNNYKENKDGIAVFEFIRAKSGLIKQEKFYNKNGELTENSSGNAIINYKYSLNGLYYLGQVLNAKGELIKK